MAGPLEDQTNGKVVPGRLEDVKLQADSSPSSTLQGSAPSSTGGACTALENASLQANASTTEENSKNILTPDMQRLVCLISLMRISSGLLTLYLQHQIQSRNADLEKSLEERRRLKDELLARYAEATQSSEKQAEDTIVVTAQSEEERADELMTKAKAQIKQHIDLLSQYNEIRDIGLGFMGMLAEERGVRLKEVQEEFGMTTKD